MLNVWKNLGVHLWTTYLIFFVKSIVGKNKNLNKKCWFFFWHAKSTVEKKNIEWDFTFAFYHHQNTNQFLL